MLADVLYPRADQRRTAVSLLEWWESRRLVYNLTVGATGVFTLVVIRLMALVPPTMPMHIIWQPIAAYALLANVFYTFGWATETVLQHWWKEQCPKIGPPLFRQGLAFSVGLTLLPIAVMSIGWVMRVGAFVFR